MIDALGKPTGAFARARTLAFVLLGLLLALFIAWHARHYRAPTAVLASAVAVAPWLLALRPLVRGRPDAYLGGLMLTTPYLGYALMELVANPGARAIAAVTMFVSFALAVAFTACLRFSRRAAAAPTSQTAL